jgi:hypothetical protein
VAECSAAVFAVRRLASSQPASQRIQTIAWHVAGEVMRLPRPRWRLLQPSRRHSVHSNAVIRFIGWAASDSAHAKALASLVGSLIRIRGPQLQVAAEPLQVSGPVQGLPSSHACPAG